VNPFSPRIEELLSAQERVDALRQEATLRSGSALCDLAYANSYDGAPKEVLAALTAAIQPSRPLDLQYTPYGGSTLARRLVGDALTASHGTRFHFRDVVLTPGAMAALNVVFRSVADGTRGEVLVVTPCWLDYPLYLENLGLEARMVPVDPRTLRLDLGRIEAALSPRTRAIVLSQPANPTGLLYSAGAVAGSALRSRFHDRLRHRPTRRAHARASTGSARGPSVAQDRLIGGRSASSALGAPRFPLPASRFASHFGLTFYPTGCTLGFPER
jgi:aspartate aminotransferase